MVIGRNWIVVGVLVGVGAVAGCASEGEEREAPELIDTKADVPGWFKHVPVDFDCGASLSGRFRGSDSAHLYSLPGESGREVEIVFDPTYRSGTGAAIAVYDAAAGNRLAFSLDTDLGKATLKFTPETSAKYLVGVFSLSWNATGTYKLDATCRRSSAGEIRRGDDHYIDSSDGMECAMPSVHCLTKDLGACPQLSPRPPGWCADGEVRRGPDSFIASSDGKECAMPSVHCVTKDWSACPLLSPLHPDFCQ